MKGLLRSGQLHQTQPIMAKLARLLPPKQPHSGNIDDDDQMNQSPMKAGPSSVQPTPPQPQTQQQVSLLN